MPCVHWEFSLGAFLCTCAEHNNSSFLQGGIADSQRKKWASLEENLEVIWLQNVVRRVFFIVTLPPHLLPLSCCWIFFGWWNAGKLGERRRERRSTHLHKHLCWEIKAQILQETKIWLTWKSAIVKTCRSLSYYFHLLLAYKKIIYSACVFSCLSCLEHRDTLWLMSLEISCLNLSVLATLRLSAAQLQPSNLLSQSFLLVLYSV